MTAKDTDTLIIIEKSHHLYRAFSQSFEHCHQPDDEAYMRLVANNKVKTVVDLTLFPTSAKQTFLSQLSKLWKGPLYIDATCAWGELLSDQFSNLTGLVATGVYSPKNCYEYFSKNGDSSEIETIMIRVGQKLLKVSNPGLCFHFPRTVAMIMNEAYIGLDELLASSEAIDKAMRFGVNYPLGPIEWAKKSGLNCIQTILLELYQQTGDPRYTLSLGLKKQSRLL